MSFELHPQLEKDTFPVTELELCKVLLINNSLYPWLILVPARNNVQEITDLSAEDYSLLTEEIHSVHTKMQEIFSPDKMNIGALGNMVPQLHIHIIARFKSDAAWPNPVWGQAAEKYDDEKQQKIIEKLAFL